VCKHRAGSPYLLTIRSHALACYVSRSPGNVLHTVRVRIDHEAAEFPYLQLAAQIREQITSGEYPPGAKLPPITEIVAQTGLSPMTIRRAYKLLEEEGLATIVPGRGTFVRK
jgi:DNA-binding transcriptional ArsR family regulator